MELPTLLFFICMRMRGPLYVATQAPLCELTPFLPAQTRPFPTTLDYTKTIVMGTLELRISKGTSAKTNEL